MVAGAVIAVVGLGATSAVAVVAGRTSSPPSVATPAGSLTGSARSSATGTDQLTPGGPTTPTAPGMTPSPSSRPPSSSKGETAPLGVPELTASPLASSLQTPVILEAQAAPADPTQQANEFNVVAQASVPTDATATWVVDYGDGSAPATLAILPGSCQQPHSRLVMDTGMGPHFFAAPGTYTITVSIGVTACHGGPGASATTSFGYQWISDGGRPGLGSSNNWVPDLSATPPASMAIPTGTVWMPPTATSPQGVTVPMYAYCTVPASVAPGAHFTITCAIISADSSTPIAVGCGYAACAIPRTPLTPQAGTAFGRPEATATINLPEVMPTGTSGATWMFTFTQGSNSYSVFPGVAAAA